MGDTRFRRALQRARDAQREGDIATLSPETCIQALAALAATAEPLLANVLASHALNQARRAATLLRSVGDGVVALDVDGRVTFANPAAEALLGLSLDEMLGHDFHELVHHQTRDGSPMAREDCRVLSVLAPGSSPVRSDDHDVFQRADGTKFFAGFVSTPIELGGETTGIALAFRDITRAKEAEAALRLQETALDAVPAPVFFVERDGCFRYVNRAAAEHLSLPRESLEEACVFDVDADMTPETWTGHWQRVKQIGATAIETRHRTRDGRIVPVTLRITHVQHEDAEFHVAVALPRA